MLRELVIPCLLMFSIDKDVDGLVVVVKFIRRLPGDFGTTEINLVFELYMGWDFIDYLSFFSLVHKKMTILCLTFGVCKIDGVLFI